MRALTRIIAAAVLAVAAMSVGAAPWSPGTPAARAQGVEILMVPSAAMGRDIPVAFQGGGPHAVVLLDAFNAAPDVSNWVTAGNAMNTLAGLGISVAAPAGGAWSMYTTGSRTAASSGRRSSPTSCRTGWPPTRGWPRAGTASSASPRAATGALTLATFHPDRFRFAGSLSGFLTPSAHRAQRRHHRGPRPVRRSRHPQHVGSAAAGPVEMA